MNEQPTHSWIDLVRAASKGLLYVHENQFYTPSAYRRILAGLPIDGEGYYSTVIGRVKYPLGDAFIKIIHARSSELPVMDTEALADKLSGDGRNPIAHYTKDLLEVMGKSKNLFDLDPLYIETIGLSKRGAPIYSSPVPISADEAKRLTKEGEERKELLKKAQDATDEYLEAWKTQTIEMIMDFRGKDLSPEELQSFETGGPILTLLRAESSVYNLSHDGTMSDDNRELVRLGIYIQQRIEDLVALYKAYGKFTMITPPITGTDADEGPDAVLQLECLECGQIYEDGIRNCPTSCTRCKSKSLKLLDVLEAEPLKVWQPPKDDPQEDEKESTDAGELRIPMACIKCGRVETFHGPPPWECPNCHCQHFETQNFGHRKGLSQTRKD